jgi:hypothetical protein
MNTAELRLSHIIPKFIWRDSGLIGAGKKFDVTCISDEAHSEANRQDGFKESLLCNACEGHFGTFERYMSQRLRGIFDRTVGRPDGSVFIWTGWDYQTTKLFQMSLLWRMGVSSLPMYGMVNLGSHTERMRRMLLAEDPGEPWRYPCACILPYHNGVPVRDLFTQPESFKSKRRDGYRYLIGGMLLFTTASNHPTTVIPRQTWLRESGEWLMICQDIREQNFIRDQIELLKARSMEN